MQEKTQAVDKQSWLKEMVKSADEIEQHEPQPPPPASFDEPDPVRWGETFLINRDGSSRSYWPHQVEDLHADESNVIHLDGRDVGKTADLSTLALHYALTTPKGSGLVAAALGGHLLSILEEIEFQLQENPKLDECVAVGKNHHRKFQRTPYPRIEFKNGSVLYFRPAGTYGEAFRSLHVDRVWVDEGAWLSEEAWRALRQCLKAGGKMRVYSTPNGMRNTTYYRLTQSSRWRVFRWPSWLNPAWDKEREADLLEFYGGRSSAGWQHEVGGEHGAVSYGAFAAESFARCVGDVLEYRKIIITGEDLGADVSEDEVQARLEAILGLIPRKGLYWLGGDLGYTRDPTEILVFEETAGDWRLETGDWRPEAGGGEEERGREKPIRATGASQTITNQLKLVLRVHMEGVGYPQIAQCLSILDSMYCPEAIGIDNGGNGLAVVQDLMTLDRYRKQNVDATSSSRSSDRGGDAAPTEPPLPQLQRQNVDATSSSRSSDRGGDAAPTEKQRGHPESWWKDPSGGWKPPSVIAKEKEQERKRLEALMSPESRFIDRLYGFDFGGVTHFELSDGTQAKKRTKELMTSLINGALQRRELLFPADDREIEDQFLTQTYTMNNGVVVYSKGNDHIIDAVRCMMLAREKVRPDGLLEDRRWRRPPLEPIIMTF